jgi:small subunit ribosomal protein S5
MTIPHAVEAKFGASKIMLFPARGSGVVAGSSARAIIEAAGIKDIAAKYLSGSKNSLNNARVVIKALQKLIVIPRATLKNKNK